MVSRACAGVLVLVLGLSLSGCSGDGASASADGGNHGASTDAGAASTLTADELLDACIRASACGVKTYPILSNCLENYIKLHVSQGLATIYNKLHRCVNAAQGDCAAVAACYQQGKACDKDYKASCNGDVALSCDLIDGRVYQLNCADAAMKCQVKTGQTFSASCTPGSCQAGYKDKCEEGQMLSCSGDVLEVKLCGVEGMRCGYGGWKTKKFGCQGETENKCSSYKFKAYCDGSKAVTCLLSREHHDDCARHKYVSTGCKGGICVVGGAECDHNFNRCAGQKLEACLDGKWQQYDCAKLGLGPCKKSATYGANCTKTQ